MANSKHQLQDFLKDEYFVHWVLHPDARADAYWKDWIAKHPEQLRQIRLARETILAFQYQDHYHLPADTHADILNTLTAHQRQVHGHGMGQKRWYVSVAATLLLLVLGAAAFWYISVYELQNDPLPVALQVKQTKKGEKLTLRLPDGTKVKLNANSVLVFPAAFEKNRRYVQLEGEAFFDVAKDAHRPFTIMSGQVETSVLGTSFNVRAYEDEPAVAVAVVEGKVSVKSEKSDEVFLTPNEVSYYHKAENRLSAARQDVSDMIAWSRNILIFDEDTEEEVWDKLENWYGVNIITHKKGSIAGKYSGRYENESLERVLEGISYAAEFDYEILENKNVVIK